MNVLENLALRSQQYDDDKSQHHRKTRPAKAGTWPRQKSAINHSSLGVQGVSVMPQRPTSAYDRCIECGDKIHKKHR